jgi:hypothetical protein
MLSNSICKHSWYKSYSFCLPACCIKTPPCNEYLERSACFVACRLELSLRARLKREISLGFSFIHYKASSVSLMGLYYSSNI